MLQCYEVTVVGSSSAAIDETDQNGYWTLSVYIVYAVLTI